MIVTDHKTSYPTAWSAILQASLSRKHLTVVHEVPVFSIQQVTSTQANMTDKVYNELSLAR